MKHVKINDKWRVSIDTNGNHMPEMWERREGGKPISGGKVSKDFEGYKHLGKYFSSMALAVKWIAEQDSDAQEIYEYVKQMQERIQEMMGNVE